ncbi:TPM domain-containing protein [Ottowia sp.]|uniref:TPM domain-containing protein n=1 Tax=Ottowia sp. TaxID=1898956 RepID=UPI003A887AFC
MLKTLIRLIRHRWLDASDAHRAVPPDMAERLRNRVAASEQRHTGEVRICVEGGLPPSYLWRHWRGGTPMRQIVRERALMMFAKLRLWDTEHNNGVLIYLLLAEHAIELVADRGIDRLVGKEGWSTIMQRMEQAHLGEDLENGLTQALEEVSALLVEHFPQAAQTDDALSHRLNQLPDEPVLR